jgi:hypothetical protein
VSPTSWYRAALITALVFMAAGCHFPQGWHWPRYTSTGSTTTQTLVYWQNDVVGYQGPYVAWAATVYDSHPELTVRMVDTCPAGRNCIVWRTGNNGGGTTWISIGGSRHLMAATVTLDDGIGRDGTILNSQKIVYHEACHAYGGGFGDEAQHAMCNFEHRAHTLSDIGRVYHNDPG